jgi:hypothetical protein
MHINSLIDSCLSQRVYYTVVPTSLEAITTIFSRPEAQGRDHTGSFHDRNFNKNLGKILLISLTHFS